MLFPSVLDTIYYSFLRSLPCDASFDTSILKKKTIFYFRYFTNDHYYKRFSIDNIQPDPTWLYSIQLRGVEQPKAANRRLQQPRIRLGHRAQQRELLFHPRTELPSRLRKRRGRTAVGGRRGFCARPPRLLRNQHGPGRHPLERVGVRLAQPDDARGCEPCLEHR